MLKKAIVLIFDGLGDRPIASLEGQTPLEYAKTPNFDKLATQAECGLMHTLGRGLRPGSDTSHLAIFGYESAKYYPGRGPIEVAGIGLKMADGDVAFRGNFGTVENNCCDESRWPDRKSAQKRRMHCMLPRVREKS